MPSRMIHYLVAERVSAQLPIADKNRFISAPFVRICRGGRTIPSGGHIIRKLREIKRG